jgi:D-cysteine desulfhydrase family pyridoxal phosphate-dependent enzyme
MGFSRIPRMHFAALPTPVEPLPRLRKALIEAGYTQCPLLFVKRDDLTGLAMGGNKTRKLEFVIAEAVAVGARTLITVGAAQSNHCRQTAALAARTGLDCILVLSGQPEDPPTGNLLLDILFGAEIVWTNHDQRDQTLQRVFDDVWAAGRRPYRIPLGASTGLGALGYAAAFDEFLGQGVPANWIIVPSSSGGTQAGLALGARRAGWPGHVLGISIDHPAKALQAVVAGYVAGAADLLEEPIQFAPADLLVDDRFLGEGYGIAGQAEREAMRLFARSEGLLLDPVYTGRAAAGMIQRIREGAFAQDERVLFWHTGGTPALFAGAYKEILSG